MNIVELTNFDDEDDPSHKRHRRRRKRCDQIKIKLAFDEARRSNCSIIALLGDFFKLLCRRMRKMVRLTYIRSVTLLNDRRKLLGALISFTLIFSIVHIYLYKDQISLKPRKQHRQLSSLPYSGYKDCNPATKIVFLKTHKCASSSIQNMLLRNAARKDLNVVLPLTGNYVGRYMPFHRSTLWGTPWDLAGMEYNLFCLHTIWNQREVEEVMKKGEHKNNEEEVVYFTILRDPVDLFVSLWDYVQFQSYYGVNLEYFALHANKTSGQFRDRNKVTNLGRNQMLWDFGLPSHDFDNEVKILAKIREVDRRFDLVLLAERFDESIVLLKDLLCWNFEDVTHIKLNARSAEAKTNLTDEARAALKEWLKADYMVYDHFAEKFKQELERFGEKKMEQELRILRSANDNVEKRCGIKPANNDELTGDGKLWGKHIVGYTVKEEGDEFCKMFGMAEMPILDQLRASQTEKAKAILTAQNRTAEFKPVDPRSFKPAAVTRWDGTPDIDKLRKIFGHLGGQGVMVVDRQQQQP